MGCSAHLVERRLPVRVFDHTIGQPLHRIMRGLLVLPLQARSVAPLRRVVRGLFLRKPQPRRTVAVLEAGLWVTFHPFLDP